MAAAKPAQAVAKWNVDIERQRQSRIKLSEPMAIRLRRHLWAEMGGRRVTGIARDPLVVFGEKI